MKLPIKGFEGLYSVTDRGVVSSEDRTIALFVKGKETLRKRKGGAISHRINGRGYVMVNLWKDGVMYTRNVHRLVGEAFINNPLNKPEINHIDGDQTNNHIANLEWCSRSENALHSINILKRWPGIKV